MIQDRIVIGDGLAALLSVAQTLAQDQTVLWIAGSGSRLIAPVNFLGELSLEALGKLNQTLTALDLDPVTLSEGQWIREFKHKSFRVFDPAEASEIPADERSLVAQSRFSFDSICLQDFESQLRARVLENGRLTRVDSSRVKRIDSPFPPSFKVELLNGETFSSGEVVFADALSTLTEIEGIANHSSKASIRKAMRATSVLQLYLRHASVGVGIGETFLISMGRESGEVLSPHLWGYFSHDGKSSIWSLFVEAEESEDNHLLMKRIRRIKQALAKCFTNLHQFEGEQVRFEEHMLAVGEASETSEASKPKSQKIPTLALEENLRLQIPILSDQHGVASTFEQWNRLEFGAVSERKALDAMSASL